MDERKRQRVLFQKDVVINGAVVGYALDISDAGMYIHTPADFVPGAVLDLDFDIGGRHISVKAAIQHMEPGVGIGVKFLNLAALPDAAMAVKNLIRGKGSARGSVEAASKKVLLVDGNSQSRSLFKIKLQQEGLGVIDASNGLDAFRALQQAKPDIVVIDPHIEGVDGFKLMTLMQRSAELKKIPVIIVSSRIIPEDVDRAVALGAKDYLVKSTTTPVKLTETVKRLLNV